MNIHRNLRKEQWEHFSEKGDTKLNQKVKKESRITEIGVMPVVGTSAEPVQTTPAPGSDSASRTFAGNNQGGYCMNYADEDQDGICDYCHNGRMHENIHNNYHYNDNSGTGNRVSGNAGYGTHHSGRHGHGSSHCH